MAKLSIIIFFILIFSNSKSQNILLNGDFEFYSSLPTIPGQLSLATGWSNLNGGVFYPFGSPDYLHTLGSGSVQLPNSSFATVHPYSGNAIAGFQTYSTQSNFREYLSSGFSSSMLVGSAYTISFWLSNGEANQLLGYGSNHIGIRFSTATLLQNDHEPLALIPQLEIPGEVWSTSWQNYSFTFIADSAYNYITIGNFFDDASTTTVLHINTGIPGSSYYFIDKIEVTPGTITPLTLMSFNAAKTIKNVLLNWSTTNEINTDKFIIEHSTDGTVFNAIGIIKATGNAGHQTNYSFTDKNPSTTNYYRLKMVDIDGSFIYSEIKKLSFNINGIEMTVIQNPFKNDISIDISSDVQIGAELFIEDITGRLMNKQTVRLMPGINSFNIQTLPLVKGVYIVGMIAGNEKRTIKIIKD